MRRDNLRVVVHNARRRLPSFVVSVALVSCALSPVAAQAQAKGRTEDPGVVAAREYVSKAATHYKLGEYEEAIAAYKEAYRLRPVAALLFNIAQAQRLAGRYSEAKRTYETYLRDEPEALNRGEVERQIRQLEGLIATETRPPADGQPTEELPPPTPGDVRDARADAREPDDATEPGPGFNGEELATTETLPDGALEVVTPAPRALVLPAIAVGATAVVLGVAAAVFYAGATEQWSSLRATERPRAEVDSTLANADAQHTTALGLAAGAGVAAIASGVLFVF